MVKLSRLDVTTYVYERGLGGPSKHSSGQLQIYDPLE